LLFIILRPYLKKQNKNKNPSQKRAGGVAQGVGRVQAPALQKKKKKKELLRRGLWNETAGLDLG
jgi:hypothetical protein